MNIEQCKLAQARHHTALPVCQKVQHAVVLALGMCLHHAQVTATDRGESCGPGPLSSPPDTYCPNIAQNPGCFWSAGRPWSHFLAGTFAGAAAGLAAALAGAVAGAAAAAGAALAALAAAFLGDPMPAAALSDLSRLVVVLCCSEALLAETDMTAGAALGEVAFKTAKIMVQSSMTSPSSSIQCRLASSTCHIPGSPSSCS